RLEHPLHHDDIEPAAELAADLALDADGGEATGGVEGDRRLVPTHDARHHRVEPVVGGQADQLLEDGLPDTPALRVAIDVDRVLHGRGVGRAGPVGRERAETDHVAVPVLGDHRRVPAGVLIEPLHLLVERARHHVEGHGRVADLAVVDGPDGLGVATLGQSDTDGAHRKPDATRKRVTRPPCHAAAGGPFACWVLRGWSGWSGGTKGRLPWPGTKAQPWW